MVTDAQVRLLFKLRAAGKSLERSAARSDMDVKTARKYLQQGVLPSQAKGSHTWRTREDAFADVWDDLAHKLELNPGLEAKTLLAYLQQRFPGRFADGQLRTLQRRVKRWRALEGPPREVFFEQRHRPGVLCCSDFTHLTPLGVTIAGQKLHHLFYHFVLSYSNWETGMICFSESFESLSEGLQKALWELGGVPKTHRSDRLSAAVNKDLSREAFTDRYAGLLRHYGLEGRKTNAASPHENGDVEQRHHRFYRALDQALMLRSSREFDSLEAYTCFIAELLEQLNAGRASRLAEERPLLAPLPQRKLDSCKRVSVRVCQGSTVRVAGNVYSVNARLIGERVEARLYIDRVEIHYGQRKVETLPRLRGKGRHHVQYRHIIDWLVRKPGAFENYVYKDDLFPTALFRVAYDQLQHRHRARGVKEYLHILKLAATENEALVNEALRSLIDAGTAIDAAAVARLVAMFSDQLMDPRRMTPPIRIKPVALNEYDDLLATAIP